MSSGSFLIKPGNFNQLPSPGGEAGQSGLAGAITGIHNNALIIAGGSDFENGYPWKGGRKKYHTGIYILKKNDENNYIWIEPKGCKSLDYPVAYGASVSTPDGVIYAGGENNDGQLTRVLQLKWTGDDILIKRLPDLPVPVSNSGATNIGSKIYLAGGIKDLYAVNSFYSLDFSENNLTWRQLANLPAVISNAVVITQNDGKEECVYILGGRANGEICSEFSSKIYKYSPASDTWTHDGNILDEDGKQFGLAAGTGLPFKEKYILLFGGDKGIIYNKVETLQYMMAHTMDSSEYLLLQQKKDNLLENHTGFFRDILLYNTFIHRMIKTGEIPGRTQVTTTAVEWEGMVYIPSGEIKPGVRTPLITVLDIKKTMKYKITRSMILISIALFFLAAVFFFVLKEWF